MALVNERALLATYKAPMHQQLVDLAQAEIRADLLAGRRSLFKLPPPRPPRSGSVLDERIAEEMDLTIRQLGQTGDMLADDPVLLSRHAAQLQALSMEVS